MVRRPVCGPVVQQRAHGLIQSHTPSAFAFDGICLGLLILGCEGAAGAVGLWEQAPRTEATDARMTTRSVRDIVGSGFGERHRYDLHHTATDISRGNLIYRGAQ